MCVYEKYFSRFVLQMISARDSGKRWKEAVRGGPSLSYVKDRKTDSDCLNSGSYRHEDVLLCLISPVNGDFYFPLQFQQTSVSEILEEM